MAKTKAKPRCVCISDIHFSLTNLPCASPALDSALSMARQLKVPLVIAGDLNDTKAIIRAEVANELLHLFGMYEDVSIYIMVGNHDMINEKGTDNGLNYLDVLGNIVVIQQPQDVGFAYLIPYQNDPERLKSILKARKPGTFIIMHQGVKGAFMGDYVVDRTSLDARYFEPFKVISGHYHRHQTIGTVTYIGSPYTISFGEANDGPKGYLIVNDDLTFTQVPMALRRHRIIKPTIEQLQAVTTRGPSAANISGYGPGDLVWVKVTGPASELDKLKKKEIGAALFGHSNFKLDKIYTDTEKLVASEKPRTDEQTLDALIDKTDNSPKAKKYLKTLWRRLV